MLIKILAILSIVGIVMSIISIFIITSTFITTTMAHTIIKKDIDISVDYTAPLIVLLISTITLACIIIL